MKKHLQTMSGMRNYTLAFLSFFILQAQLFTTQSVAQNAIPGCDKYTLLLAEFTNNFANSTTMAIPFPNPPGTMPTSACDLGDASGNDGIAIDPDKNIAYIVAGQDIRVYDFAAGAFINSYTVPNNGGGVYDVVLSQDKQTLFISTPAGLRILNIAAGTFIERAASIFTGNGGGLSA